MSTTIKHALEALISRQDLSREDTQAVFQQIMTGEATPSQIAAILVAFASKGETPAEIAGAVDTMRALSTKVAASGPHLVDTCGTGGSGMKLFNISTAAAFVTAAAGAKVAKHGNRGMTSKSGSADVLEAAGVNLELAPEQLAHCIEEVGIGFMFAQAHHSAMRFAGPVRQEIGVRTMMNILGPMTNPAGAPNQMLGVFSPERQRTMAEVLQLLGSEHVVLVHSNGLDEIRLDAPTQVVELHKNNISEYSIRPAEFDIEERSVDELRTDSVEASLALVKQSLTDPDSAAADIVSLNAGASIYAAGVATNLKNGITMAQDAIAAGLAKERLDELVRITKLMASG